MTLAQVTFERLEYKGNDAKVIEAIELVCLLCKELGHNYDILTITKAVTGVLSNSLGVMYCAYHGGEMVGVMGFVYNPEMWNSEEVTATEVAWYLKPAYRGTTGGAFIKHVEQNLECGKVRIGVGSPFLRRMLERNGYKCTKYTMEKVLHG
jgi:hypothetical protein